MPLPSDYATQACPLARSLEIVGERWTMLILRDLFFGVHRFGELVAHMDIPRAVLTARLTALVEQGLVERRPYSAGRDEFHLTERGRELWPVLHGLMEWGERHCAAAGGAPARLPARRVRDRAERGGLVPGLRHHPGSGRGGHDARLRAGSGASRRRGQRGSPPPSPAAGTPRRLDPLVDCPRMTVRDLLGEGPAVEIGGLAYDNRAVEPGTLFFCVPGFTRDGHEFAADAVARGAAALVVARPVDAGVPEVQVEDVRAAMAIAAARFYGDPTARLPIVGVTGTNGKTTTAFLVRALLEAAGRRCGLLGTVLSVVAGEERPTVRTTPEAIDLQRTFREMLDGGDTACAMEISSHALELRRADGIHVAVAVFTNLTQDHLDFHPTMEDYFRPSGGCSPPR